MATDDLLEGAQACHLNGRLAEAEQFYRHVLEADPDSVRALEGLGLLLFQRGQAAHAARFLRRGVDLRGDSARLHANLGEALRVLKQFERAHEHLRKAVSLQPELAQAWNSLGLLATDQRRHRDAELAFREAIRLKPAHTAARVNHANALRNLQRKNEAIASLRAVLGIEPNNITALVNLGQMLCETGDHKQFAEALALCRRAVTLAPDRPALLDALGKVLRLQGRLEETKVCHLRSIAINPRDPVPHHHLGQLLNEQGRFREAHRQFLAGRRISPAHPRFHLDLGDLLASRRRMQDARPHYLSALDCDPLCAEAHHGLGMVLLDEGRLDDAEKSFREALRLDDTLAISWTGIARLQAERGDFEQSCRSARTALAKSPGMAEAFRRLAVNLQGRLTDTEVTELERLIRQKNLAEETRATLSFSLALVNESRGLHSQAAAFFDVASAALSKSRSTRGQSYDAANHSKFIERMITAFPRGIFDRAKHWGNPDPLPVFVVGLPRSGTSLVEQILASHPAVHGAGELHDLHDVFQSLPRLVGREKARPIEALAALDQGTARTLARDYLDRLIALAPSGVTRVVDKMPDNFRLLGLIGLILPGAKVIICKRDVRDVAVSCRQAAFTSNPWSTNWQHTAQRFADHQRLFKHWRLTRPITWLEITYEECVRNLERDARRMIDFLGLDWNAACLDFAATRRVVRTASVAQVREPIHDRSVGRWRRYEAWHEPMLKAFQAHGVELEETD
jgi:tetratricopeptide (TPR) repeat protein